MTMPMFTVDPYIGVPKLIVPFQGRHVGHQFARALTLAIYDNPNHAIAWVDIYERDKHEANLTSHQIRVPIHTIPALIEALSYAAAGELGRLAILRQE
jgi:hypothetical protein